MSELKQRIITIESFILSLLIPIPLSPRSNTPFPPLGTANLDIWNY